MDFNHYFTNDEIELLLKNWETTYPNLVKITPIGSSHEGRPIWLLTITNQATGIADEKPAFWIDGNIHATELTGATAALYVANALLSGYTQNEHPEHNRITRLLDTSAYYILPRVNPDGAAWALAPNPGSFVPASAHTRGGERRRNSCARYRQRWTNCTNAYP